MKLLRFAGAPGAVSSRTRGPLRGLSALWAAPDPETLQFLLLRPIPVAWLRDRERLLRAPCPSRERFRGRVPVRTSEHKHNSAKSEHVARPVWPGRRAQGLGPGPAHRGVSGLIPTGLVRRVCFARSPPAGRREHRDAPIFRNQGVGGPSDIHPAVDWPSPPQADVKQRSVPADCTCHLLEGP